MIRSGAVPVRLRAAGKWLAWCCFGLLLIPLLSIPQGRLPVGAAGGPDILTAGFASDAALLPQQVKLVARAAARDKACDGDERQPNVQPTFVNVHAGFASCPAGPSAASTRGDFVALATTHPRAPPA